MSAALEALAALDASISALPRVPRLPERQCSELMLLRLGGAAAAPKTPPGPWLEALRGRLSRAFSGGKPAVLPSPRDLRDASWILWAGERPAAAFPGLLDTVLAHAERSPRALRALIEAWLRDFAPVGPGVAAAGARIARALERDGADARVRDWRDAHRRFGVFDAAHGPRRLAAALLCGEEQPAACLAAAGFEAPARANGGYMRAVQAAAAAALPEALRGSGASAALARAVEVFAPEERLRFWDERCKAARGFLGAWLGGREPALEVRDAVKAFLLRHLKDPRLAPENWRGAGEDAVSLMRRWLAQASLETFFGLIADHALDHQWRFREAFWSAVVRKAQARPDLVVDAWLALGSRVHASARATRALGGAFAKLEGGGVTGTHSVLLLRLGPLVVCEWSHNGALRAWPHDWKNAPRLHHGVYSRDDLIGAGLPFPGTAAGQGLSHTGSPRGLWQGRAAELIERRAGVRVTEADWRLR